MSTQKLAAVPTPMESQDAHPLKQKPLYWQGPAYYGKTLYTIRVLGHSSHTVYIDLWNDQTPLFSVYADYTSIRLPEPPAAAPETTSPQEQQTPVLTPEAHTRTCFYCHQPATQEHAQILNDHTVCSACIIQELAAIHPDELEPPTDPEPEPPTLTGGQEEAERSAETNPADDQAPAIQTEAEPVAPAQVKSQETYPIPAEPPKANKRTRQPEKQGAHRISLRWQSDAFTVSDEGYEKIQALIKEYATCHRCEQHYTVQSPNVAGNVCLACFLAHHHSLTYVGAGETGDDGIPQYLFLDNAGHIHAADPGPSRSEDGREDYIQTLIYWGFPIPDQIEKAGQSQKIETKSGRWSIYGDPHRSTVIVHVWDTYPDKAEAYFLVSKAGKLAQVNKRKASHRQLLATARKRIDATKRTTKYGSNSWTINGIEHLYINEYHEYCMLARMLDEQPQLWP
ncbi:hypothetical protein KDA_77170 [Dictyobacter alpinus]|uniref:Uncharacterized protein n=1 Tax=Dictyobacter alpinus TaxID=2014873 RepID=A0A402BLJ7_9CHLR|nr:hypothetical protein [Dictyobacter alpinus]GCE32233.1 hypothetical protein KDA_77170 [Dictyobacter alpinus]